MPMVMATVAMNPGNAARISGYLAGSGVLSVSAGILGATRPRSSAHAAAFAGAGGAKTFQQ